MTSKSTLERRLLQYLIPHWKIASFAALFAMGVAVTQLALAYVANLMLDLFGDKSHPHRLTDAHKLGVVCILLAGIYFARWFIMLGQNVLFAEVGQRVGQQLRLSIYGHLQSLSLSYFDKQRTGNLLSTFSNDVPIVQNGIMSLKDVIASPILVVVGVISIFVISWKLTLITLLLLPVMGTAINNIVKKQRAISLETQNRLGEVTTIAEETLAGARLVRAFGAEQREITRFGQSVQAAKDIYMRGVFRSSLLSPTTDLLGAIGMATALWLGGSMVMNGSLTLGHLAAFAALIDRIRVGIGGIGNIGVTWKQTLGAADRIFGGVLDVPTDIFDMPNAKPLDLTNGEVAFESVSFGYRKDQLVLENVSFTMRAGQITAIVGPSGAGKSTLADLIPRFYDPTFGYIGIDGQDVRGVTVSSLRHHIGIVPQETIIFGGTVKDNISYGRPDASPEMIVSAAKAANAHEFINQLQNGYETIVGERGVTLSGGQRQRIAIARALLKDPRILILDEATSSLDEASQVLVQEALEKLMLGRTTLVIAHRLSTIKNADRIVVLEAGQIVESGSHLELLRRNGVYKRLYETQFRSDDPSPAIEDAA